MTAGSGRSPASTGLVKRTARSVIGTDVAREPLGDGLDRAQRGRVAGLVDVAVTGAGLEVEHRTSTPASVSVAANASPDGRSSSRSQTTMSVGGNPWPVTESGERLRIREDLS